MAYVIVKDRLWPKVKYEPHAGQVAIHHSRARHRVNAAGRRFGKSQVGGHELIPEVYKAHFNQALLEDMGLRQEYWIVGPNYTDAEKEFRVFYNDCRKLKLPLDRPGTYYDSRSGNMQVSMWSGRFLLQAKSAAHPESLVGEGLHGVVMAEAAKMKESVWSKYVRPTLADFRGWSLWNSTPEGKNFFYEMWRLGQDPSNNEWESWRQPSWTNPYVFHDGISKVGLETLRDPQAIQRYDRDGLVSLGIDPEIVDMYYDLGETMFAQEVECSFTEYAGRVYYMWDEETHVRDLDYNPQWPVYLALDYGFTNPNVILALQVDKFDNVYVLGEYYRSHRTEQEMADDVLSDPRMSTYIRMCRAMYPDPEDPGASTFLSGKFKSRVMGGTGGLIKDRVNLIRRWLTVQNQHLPVGHVDRQPKLLVDRSCTNLIREMDAYRYPELRSEVREAPENPLKKDDHAPEALSRFFAGFYGTGAVSGGPRVRKATVG